MSCNSTYFLLLHGSLIKLLILSMSSIWKKEVNIVSAHHECDCTCYVHAIVHTLENNKKYTGIVFKEISEFHISSNLLVPPKLSITLNLTSRHWESILSKILSLHRAWDFKRKSQRKEIRHISKCPISRLNYLRNGKKFWLNFTPKSYTWSKEVNKRTWLCCPKSLAKFTAEFCPVKHTDFLRLRQTNEMKIPLYTDYFFNRTPFL